MLTGCRVQTRKRVHPNFRNNKSEVNIFMVKVDMIICYFYRLLPHLKGNVGLVFTKDELCEVRDKILENKVAAPAKAGALAPIDVSIPPQNTGLGPEKTSFFQALSIPTKISKGTIEILVSLYWVNLSMMFLRVFPLVHNWFIRGHGMSHCVCSVAHTRIRRRVGHRVSVVGFFLLSPLSQPRYDPVCCRGVKQC